MAKLDSKLTILKGINPIELIYYTFDALDAIK